MSFINLKNVANCSPCCTSLTNLVTKLARDQQYLIFSSKIDNSNIFCQSDGGQKGQEVRLFSLLNETNTTESENGSSVSSGPTLLAQVRQAMKLLLVPTIPSRNLAIHPNKSMAAPATVVLEPPSPKPMPVPKLGSDMNKASLTRAVSTASNLHSA
jgi:hypothetical protein